MALLHCLHWIPASARFVPPLVESGPVRRISGDGTSSYDFICFGSALVAVLPIFQTADHKQVLAWFA